MRALLWFSPANLSCFLAGQSYTIDTLAGGGPPPNGVAASTRVRQIAGSVVADREGNVYFACQAGVVLKLEPGTGLLSQVAGSGQTGFSGDGGPATAALVTVLAMAFDANDNLYLAGGNRIRKISNGVITTIAGNGVAGFGGDNGPATNAFAARSTRLGCRSNRKRFCCRHAEQSHSEDSAGSSVPVSENHQLISIRTVGGGIVEACTKLR